MNADPMRTAMIVGRIEICIEIYIEVFQVYLLQSLQRRWTIRKEAPHTSQVYLHSTYVYRIYAHPLLRLK